MKPSLSFAAAVLQATLAFCLRPIDQPFRDLLAMAAPTSEALQVDLRYAVYEGAANNTQKINAWKG
jgi:hypothetical protein